MGISGLPLRSPGTKSHLDVAPAERHKVYNKGESGVFPQVQVVVSLVSLSCPWSVLTPKVLQLCIKHLVLILCRFVWLIEACQFFLVPSQSSSTPFYPSKVLWARERAPTLHSFVVFSLDSHLRPSRSWERVISSLLFSSSSTCHCWRFIIMFEVYNCLLFKLLWSSITLCLQAY